MGTRVPVCSVLTFGVLLTCAGCAGQNPLPSFFPQLSKPPDAQDGEAMKPLPDAPACKGAEKCAAHLRKLVADPKRSWLGERQGPGAYADGTRLFAYRVLKPKLSCAELAKAYQETSAVLPELKGETHAATRRLMAQVDAELRAERRRRCKRAGKS